MVAEREITYPSGFKANIITRAVPGFEPANPTTAAPLFACDVNATLSAHFSLFDFVATGKRGTSFARVSPALVEALEEIWARVGPVSIVCGYRTAAQNRKFGGATNSTHVDGLAADIWAAGVDVNELHRVACEVIGKAGGVGLHAAEGFVHVDVRGFEARWGLPIEPQAPPLSMADIITAAEHILSGNQPTNAGIKVEWIRDDLWGCDSIETTWTSLADLGWNRTEEEEAETNRVLQAQALEAALREILSLLEHPPTWGNLSLNALFRRAVRRELTRLLGLWYGLDND